MPQVHGILEIALSVADPHRSAEFYRRLFGFRPLLESERLIALEVAGARQVLLLFRRGATSEPSTTPGGVIPAHAGGGQGHLAFRITADEVPLWRQRLQAEGIPLESTVTWDGSAQSLYFRDPDQHLVELMTPGFWQFSAPSEAT